MFKTSFFPHLVPPAQHSRFSIVVYLVSSNAAHMLNTTGSGLTHFCLENDPKSFFSSSVWSTGCLLFPKTKWKAVRQRDTFPPLIIPFLMSPGECDDGSGYWCLLASVWNSDVTNCVWTRRHRIWLHAGNFWKLSWLFIIVTEACHLKMNCSGLEVLLCSLLF